MSSQNATGAGGWSEVPLALRMAVLRGWNDVASERGYPRDFDTLSDLEQKNYERGRLFAVALACAGTPAQLIAVHRVVLSLDPPQEFVAAEWWARQYGAVPPAAPQKTAINYLGHLPRL